MIKRSVFLTIIVTLLIATPSYADSSFEEQLKTRLLNRVGTASEDRRQDEHALRTPIGPGPKTGCHGDTLDAAVTITGVEVQSNSPSSYVITVSYSGKYHRQGWITPCIQSPPPKGNENLNLTGQGVLTITQAFMKAPSITFGEFKNLGEKADPNHDSNVLARRALISAINGAF